MAKKNVTAITDREQDFAQWYTDIVKKAELIDYSSVKGCVILRPNAYSIWENIQKVIDLEFKKNGLQNVYLPMFIPESLLMKEADHVEGFAPEVALVTHAGNEKLEENLCVRPTSEALFCEHFKSILQSHRDLPIMYNQWCSVVRWEKTTRPFLRTSEFLWQEGHTIHETSEEAEAHTLNMLNLYADFFENYLAIPVLKGRKTDKEKFAGAEATYTVEALMHDCRSLQSGTSHYFGTGFAEAFNITYTNKENKLANPYQTSFGVSTRMLGAIIMVHGDNNGIVIPPRIAPTQVVIVPIRMNDEGVLDKACEIKNTISQVATVKLDDSDKNPGWKFSENEMKGVPIRLEIGPKDIADNKCVLVRRDTLEKIVVSLDNINEEISSLLDTIHYDMLERARNHKEENTHIATTYDEFKDIVENKVGFVKTMWCKDLACEEKIKEELGATSRCMPFEQENLSDTCVCCGRPAETMIVWGKAY